MATILSLHYWHRVYAQWYRGDIEQPALESSFPDMDDQQYDNDSILCRGMERKVGSTDNRGSDALFYVYLLSGDFNMGVDQLTAH